MKDVDPTKADSLYQAGAVTRDLDLMAADFPEREYETYRTLRERLPICRPENMRSGGGLYDGAPSGTGWFMSRFEDVAYACRHPEVFSSNIGLPFIPQGVDPPEHTEYRRLMNSWFSQQALDPLEPYLHEFAAELVEKMASMGEFDFVKEFGEPFPTIVFCQLMGFPLDDVPRMMRWKDVFIHGPRANKAKELGLETDHLGRPKVESLRKLIMSTIGELYSYFGELIEDRRGKPRDDVLTKLVQTQYGGERPLTQDELLRTLHLLMLGGLDTVTGTLGQIMVFLAEQPEKRREFIALMEDSERLDTAIEELLRYTAIVSPGRRVTRDFSYRGVDLQEGDFVVLSTPSANRDESVFEQADEVIFDRHPNQHVGFVVGPHRCLGMHLARREIRVALVELHRRIPEYHIKPGEKPGVYTGGLKGVDYLPLVVGG